MTERAEDLQTEALRAFTLLTALRPEWGGALILACGLSSGGQALSIAANIAGAGFLAIDSRPEICRAALRSGACDFVVNTVDEALRVLKNELRQRRPVSVALQMGEDAALKELLDRGVLPELFTAFASDNLAVITDNAAQRFHALGSMIVRFHGVRGLGLDASAKLEEFTSQRGLSSVCFSFLNAEQVQARDAQLVQLVPPDDPRRRWFASASRFFHRERPHRRMVYLTADERDKMGMDAAITSVAPSGEPKEP